MEARGKRRFSSMNNESVESKRISEIAQIEQNAADDERLAQIDSNWYNEFQDETRISPLARPPALSDNLTKITQKSLDLLNSWYTQLTVRFCVVNAQTTIEEKLADPDTIVASLLPNHNPLDLYRGNIESNRISSLDYFDVEPLDPNTTASQLNGDRIIVTEYKPSGTMGLSNLGNSCYMNSSLQCLTHVPELIEYFLSGDYKQDVNVDNPIGYGGLAAEAFASLIYSLYCGQGSSYSPSVFKTTMGRFNRSFAGYLQQDSQEFTAFLLDALHEDLNRIKQKPATEKPELPDDKVNDEIAINQLAEECWDLHKKRNNSVILDLFTGLYKSTLVCPECNRVSITFDPFGDLTLPFPNLTVWLHTVYFFGLDGSFLKFDVSLQTHSNIAQLKAQVLQVIGRECVLEVAEIHGNKFWQWFGDNDTLGDKIGNEDVIAVYETTQRSLPVLSQHSRFFFGMPFTVQINEDDTLETVRQRLQTFYEKLYGEPAASFKISRQPRSSQQESMIYMNRLELLEPDTPDEQLHNNNQVASSPQSQGCQSDEGEPNSEPFEMVPTPEPEQPEQHQQEQTGATLFGPYDVIVCQFETELEMNDPVETENAVATQIKQKMGANTQLTLDDCFELFSTPEVLGENDLWYCSNCKEFRQATKRIQLWKCPDIFTIHLKRFRDIHSSRDKITDVVDFPIEGLDMTKRVLGANGEQYIYDLIAVDNHFGGLGGGHYTAFAKNPVDDKWYYFNDSSVSSADPEDSIGGAAYLLFYRKRSSEHLGGVDRDLPQVLEEACNRSKQEARGKILEKHLKAKSAKEAAATDSPPAYNRFEGHGNRLGSSSENHSVWSGNSFLDKQQDNVSEGEEPEEVEGEEESDNASIIVHNAGPKDFSDSVSEMSS